MEKENRDKGYILAYDLKSLPKMNTIKEIARGANEKGIVLWDSSNGGAKPQVVHLGGDKNSYLKDIEIIDIFKVE